MEKEKCKGCKYLEQKQTYQYPGTYVCTKGLTYPISLVIVCPIEKERGKQK